jgi:tetratricopeptide (TPR) repeat protein
VLVNALPSGRARTDAALLSSRAGQALTQLHYEDALALSNRGLELAPDDGWLLYQRGCALAGLDRTGEALLTLHRAELRLPEARRPLAIYRAAIALEQTGRCAAAERTFDRYARTVEGVDPASALDARTHGQRCELRAERQNVSGRNYPK